MDDTAVHFNQGSFRPGVKIGNWNEDQYLKEEQLADFLITARSGDLSFHKTDALIKASTSPADIGTSKEGQILYGDRVLLVNHNAKCTLASLPKVHGGVHEVASDPDALMVVAAGVGEADAHQPMRRNVFTVEPSDGQALGSPVVFEEGGFLLMCENPTAPGPLYLRSEKTHISSSVSRLSKEQVVSLHPNKDGLNAYGSVWCFVLKNPSLRFESVGQPVQANTEVVIKHKQTGECLSCNFNQVKKVVSHFGAEHEVTASTKMTRAKVEAPENIWVVAMK